MEVFCQTQGLDLDLLLEPPENWAQAHPNLERKTFNPTNSEADAEFWLYKDLKLTKESTYYANSREPFGLALSILASTQALIMRWALSECTKLLSEEDCGETASEAASAFCSYAVVVFWYS